MSPRKRLHFKGRADNAGGFLLLPHRVMASPAFRGLSAHAVKLLCDIGGQFRGKNNGDLCAAWRVMQPLGWRSRDTLTRALRELREAGLIEMTRQGGMNRCSLFAMTWLPIDDCRGKLDVAPTCKPSGLWKREVPQEKQNANTVGELSQHASRVDRIPQVRLPTREAC